MDKYIEKLEKQNEDLSNKLKKFHENSEKFSKDFISVIEIINRLFHAFFDKHSLYDTGRNPTTYELKEIFEEETEIHLMVTIMEQFRHSFNDLFGISEEVCVEFIKFAPPEFNKIIESDPLRNLFTRVYKGFCVCDKNNKWTLSKENKNIFNKIFSEDDIQKLDEIASASDIEYDEPQNHEFD